MKILNSSSISCILLALCVVFGRSAAAFSPLHRISSFGRPSSTLLKSSFGGGPPYGPPPPGPPGGDPRAEAELRTGAPPIPERAPVPSFAARRADAVQPSRPGVPGPRRDFGPGDIDRPFYSNIWETAEPIVIQGMSLRTWPIPHSGTKRVRVSMKTDGRPLNANVDLWHGPDYTPTKMTVYIEDGHLTPFNAVIETPKPGNTVAIRNINPMEFPLVGCVEADDGSSALGSVVGNLYEMGKPRLCQGGSITTYPFDPDVDRVQVLLKTDGRNMKARLELMQGPNNDKQIIEVYASDGKKNPFFAVFDCPGSGYSIRVINENTMEFPFLAFVEPV